MPKIALMRAYGVKNDQISGPPWLDDSDVNCITIAATMSPDTTTENFQLMLQNLLVERFHLVVRHELKDFPGYELVVPSGGPKLKEAAPEDNVGDAPRPFGPPGKDGNGFPVRRPGSTGTTSASNGMIRARKPEGPERMSKSESFGSSGRIRTARLRVNHKRKKWAFRID
jgi:uncharacterized protein (TIGR03435 family)